MNKLDARFIKEVGQFKNRIINGDFSVAQRGESFRLENEARYTIDRVFSNVEGYTVGLRRDKVYALDEGSLVNTLDIFGDGSCIATYTFDGNANDLSGNYNGTWSGNEQYDIGKFGQCAKFDGSSYMAIPSPLTSLPASISLWFKTTQTAHGSTYWNNPTLIGFATAGDASNDFGIEIKDGYIGTFLGLGVEDYYYSRTLVSDGVWHNVILKLQPSLATLYLDGNKLYERDINSNTLADVAQWYMGVMYNYDGSHVESASYFKGFIDQVRIFNRALTDDEIKILYTESNHYKESPTYFLYYKIEDEDTSNSNRHIHSFVYRFEGQHLYDLAIQGKKVTLSFEFASNKNGDYSLSFRNCTRGVTDSYIKKFTYNGDGEFQRFEFTFDLSEFPKRFENDENVGFELIIGSNDKNYEAPSEGLHTGVDYHFLTGTNQWQKGDWFRIRRVQLEEGDRATEFEYVPYEIQLMRCMRYYEVLEGSYSDDCDKYNEKVYLPFKVVKRVTPTIKYENVLIFRAGSWQIPGSISIVSSRTYVVLNVGDASAFDLVGGGGSQYTTNPFKVVADAEL